MLRGLFPGGAFVNQHEMLDFLLWANVTAEEGATPGLAGLGWAGLARLSVISFWENNYES